jgi:hypothetical protein
MFNPKLNEFMQKNPDQKIVAFAWSLYWRIAIVIFGIAFAIGVVLGINS